MNVQPETDAIRGRTILFVDDEPLSLKYFKASVGRYANVVTADSPDAALKILESQGDAISVVVSDERMPRDSGVSFLSNVRKSWPQAVRILTSAYANIDLQQAINGAGIHCFLPKPWDLDELCSAMQEALHVERAQDRTDAKEERVADAENASLELLAVLSRELVRPLQSLEAEASVLSAMSELQTALQVPNRQSQTASWSAQLRAGKAGAAAGRMQRDIAYCKALAEPISALAESLCEPLSNQTFSMTETASAVMEKVTGSASGKFITLDARNDFQYRAPKQVITFVLLDVMRRTIRLARNGADILIELVPSQEFNEVRIIAPIPRAPGNHIPELERACRSALWAFGGELLLSSDNTAGTETASIRLPKPQTGLTASTH
ncbi:response regulator [Hyphomicrobium sp.]|jgi:two-component system probable response regulator PhcQ|uniref:response regulator n=1 Tax=Hyphomicrobium sp. TaxID=82 RepID=UPI002C986EB5|nr:response regulator [Hyphomicrobium sp.]HVZ03754.1 response regulator [Hyphomicrobium sp.]